MKPHNAGPGSPPGAPREHASSRTCSGGSRSHPGPPLESPSSGLTLARVTAQLLQPPQVRELLWGVLRGGQHPRLTGLLTQPQAVLWETKPTGRMSTLEDKTGRARREAEVTAETATRALGRRVAVGCGQCGVCTEGASGEEGFGNGEWEVSRLPSELAAAQRCASRGCSEGRRPVPGPYQCSINVP